MTETDISNLALDRIGEPMISDFAENSPNAITCRRHYEAVRDSLLRSHPWNFATGRAQLTADSTAPEFGYSYSYQLPVDCLRELTLNGVEAKKCEASYTIEGRKLLTDAPEARITYVKKVEDPNDFDSLFSDVLAFRLAAAIAVSVTGSESKRDGMEQMAALRLNDASFVDANETSPRVLSPLRSGRRSRSNDFRDYGNAPDAGVDLDNGEDGANGWTPTFAVVSDGDRRVLWVTSWTGGAGTEPDAGYLGASGIVASAATAVDIRGIQGEIGPFGTNLHIGLTAPEDPEAFPLWWKSDIGLLMIWYDDGTSEQWVSAVGAGPVGPSAYQSYVNTTADDPVLSEAAWIESLGGGGGGTWGSITGTLADQTDLQAALDGKADSLGSDDNYVTDAEKVVIGNTSGTNTGDQTNIPNSDLADMVEGTTKGRTYGSGTGVPVDLTAAQLRLNHRGLSEGLTGTSGTLAITSGVHTVYLTNTLAGSTTLTLPPADDYEVGDSIEVVDLLGKQNNQPVYIQRPASGAGSTDTFFVNRQFTEATITYPVISGESPGFGFRVRKIASGRWRVERYDGSLLIFSSQGWVRATSAGWIAEGYENRALQVQGTSVFGNVFTSAKIVAFSNSASTEGLSVGTNPPGVANGDLFLRLDASDRWIATASGGSPIDFKARSFFRDRTDTATATTGAQTIDKAGGSVNFAATATSLVVTNSLVSSTSTVQVYICTNDTTMKSAVAVAGSGSFTIYPNAAPTAETRVAFIVH